MGSRYGGVVKYIGSKRVLVPHIVDVIGRVRGVRTVADLFSGTSRVGHALKGRGYRVIANDSASYAACLARCYVQADAERVGRDAARLIDELNGVKGAPGYFTETFCERSRFFHPKNGERVDAVRDAIAGKGLDPELESVVLTSLMLAADRVDSTTGVQMAYLKSWAPRAHKDLELRVPELLPRAAGGAGAALCLDAADAAGRVDADLVYLDPPYNQHSYLSNYHVWETLVRWDAPEVYGVACKRVDCKTRKSAFNSKVRALDAMRGLLARVDAPHVVVSFNDEGYIGRGDIEGLLAAWGEVAVIGREHKRYVGAQIGVHNPRGERVGTVGRLRNTEYLFVAGPEATSVGLGSTGLVGAA